MSKVLRVYLIVGALALVGAFFTQAFLPALGSAGTMWGVAPGWQREIAFWNVGLIVMIVGVLVKGDANSARILATGTVVLGVLLGTNHLFGYLAGASSAMPLYGAHGGTLWHVYGAAVNYIGAAAGAWGIRTSK